jgi:DNA-directed RNA polymerase subunit M/transcription elongation factor TFIIS
MVEFCDRCGSFMQQTRSGYMCPRCGWEKKAALIQIKTGPETEAEPVYVMSGVESAIQVNRRCPMCGYNKAYHNITVAIGEHAGVNTDRSVERFKCVKCGHTWMRN